MGLGAYVKVIDDFRERAARTLVSPHDIYFLVNERDGYTLAHRRRVPKENPRNGPRPPEPTSPTISSPQSREHVVGKITEFLPGFECKFVPVDDLVRPLGNEKNADSAAGYVLTVNDESGNDIPPLKLKNAWWAAMKAAGLDPRLTNGISYSSVWCVGSELWINNSVIDALNHKRWEQKEGVNSRAERLACAKLGMEGCGNNDSLHIFAQALSQALGTEKARLHSRA